MPSQDPSPRKDLLTADAYSTMQFMRSEMAYDSETGEVIRFRGPFIMPDWAGVEDNESDYIVENDWMRVDILARRYYGDERLKWVIAARNSLDLPSVQLHKGRLLKIPNKEWVDSTLLPQGKRLVSR